MNEKEVLVSKIYNYLSFDQNADNKFHNPFKDNDEYWQKLKKDAENIAKIAMGFI